MNKYYNKYGYDVGTPKPKNPFIETTEENRVTKTIEEISYTKSAKDLWNELNDEINPLSCMLHLQANKGNIPLTVRFLGPFIKVQRFYSTFGLLNKNSPPLDIKGIANRDFGAIATAEKIFKDYLVQHANTYADTQSLSNAKDALDKLKSIRNGETTWQNCVMTNVLLRKGYGPGEQLLRILPIPRSLSWAIFDITIGHSTPIKISGISAHDISISKHGKKFGTQFDVKMSKEPLPLTKQEIEIILSNGLYDIPSVLEGINAKGTSSYYYRLAPNYKISPDFLMPDDIKENESDKHLECVEEYLDEVPKEAFEKVNQMHNAIKSLEIE